MTMPDSPQEALDTGIDAADPIGARERADTDRWFKRIEDARKFDEEPRKQYARDRRYARGDTASEVGANLAGTYIDILESFLYARDPDVDALPAKACEPPSVDAVQDAVELMMEQGERPPELVQAGAQAAAVAVAQGLPQEHALIAGQIAEDQAFTAYVQAEHDRIMRRYRKRMRDAKAFGETVEIVVSRLWADAGLKRRGRRWVRSALTVGVGILKASWQERTAPSPETVQAINDLQDNIKRAAAQRAALEEQNPGIFERIKQGVASAFGQDVEAKLAEYQRQLDALKGQAEQVIARGFVVDVVQAEDFQVAPGFAIADHCDAPWNAHRIPMLALDAQATFGLTDEQLAKATRYTARKPETGRDEAAILDTVRPEDADAYTVGGPDKDGGDWVMVWEIWDREANSVLTGIEGIKRWVKPCWQPTATTRFYPFFLVTTSEVDGQRHPQSLVARSAKLIDEYNRIGSAEAEHRRRVCPGMIFNAGQIDAGTMSKLTGSAIAEYSGINPTNPNVDLRTLFVEKAYPALNPALYDRQRIVGELERLWGIQEALSGAIDTPKTATEAEIQQSGFQARSSGRRDLLEAALQELALYTAEVAHAHLSAEDVAAMAGPNAMWPEYAGPESLNALLAIEIRAGSSGKPNTSAERQAMSAGLPLYQAAIDKIGALRGSTPQDLADCHETLVRIFADRVGDRIDMDSLIPKPGPMPVMAPGGTPGAVPGEPGGTPANDESTPAQAGPLAA